MKHSGQDTSYHSINDGATDAAVFEVSTGIQLPVEISFLLEFGVSSEDLASAARRAETWGVSAEQALIAMELVDAEIFYRALARHLNLPFLGPNPAIDVAALSPATPMSGILPLIAEQSGVRFALAPRGPALRRLLTRPAAEFSGVVITTPHKLAALAREAAAGKIAFQAANNLANADPALSIRDGATTRQIIATSAIAGIIGYLSVDYSMLALSLIAAVATIIFLTIVVLRIAAAREDCPIKLSPKLAYRLPDSELPIYTMIIPLYREARVLPQLLEALKNIDYPAAKLEAKLIVETEDVETRTALGMSTLPPFVEVVVAPHGQPRTKPRALNIALTEARGDLVVVYDAEDIPDPLQLRQAANAFARAEADVACMQARLVIDNTYDSWLTRMFTIEYAQLFDVFNPALSRFQLPIALGGTSNHFRTNTLRAAFGWDAWNVTEDADFGFRLAVLGYRVEDLPSSTLEEAPAKLSTWLHQRTRWLKGWMQVCVTHSRRPGRTLVALGGPAVLTMIALSFGTVVTCLGYPFFTILAILGIIKGDWLLIETPNQILGVAISLTIFISGIAAILLPALQGLRKRGLMHLAPWLLLLPIYYALMSIAAWRALWEIIHQPFKWHKTEHGLALTTRSGSLKTIPILKKSLLKKSPPDV